MAVDRDRGDEQEVSSVAAELLSPATGARVMGQVRNMTVHGATIELTDASSAHALDVGASVDATFVSSVLGGSRSLPGVIRRMSGLSVELAFVSQANTPTGSLFNRRGSLRLRPEAVNVGRQAELAWGTGDRNTVEAAIDDLSMSGAALLLARRSPWPEPGTHVRLRLTGKDGLTVWLSGQVVHANQRKSDRRLGIEFNQRIANIEGASPALRELVRQIEKIQLDELVLAFAGIGPDVSR